VTGQGPTEGTRVQGWVTVAGVFVVLTAGVGTTFYSASAFTAALVRERGFSLTVASSGPTAFFLASGLGGTVVARVLPRLGVRRSLLLGAAGSAAGLLLIGLSRTPWQLWGAEALMGAVGAFMGGVPCISLVARWHRPDPARALALATTGMSAGGALVPPLVVVLIDRYRLFGGAGLLAAGMLVVVTLVVLLVREPPAGPVVTAVRGNGGGTRESEPTVRPLLFPVLALAFALLLLSQVSAVTHLLTLARERGIGDGGLALTVLAMASVAARLLGIPVMARIGLLRYAVGIAGLQAAGMMVLAGAGNGASLCLAAGMLGATIGNVGVLMPLHMLAGFGLARFERRFSQLNLVSMAGTAGGPLLLGLLHGLTGTYRIPVLGLGCGSAAAGLLLLVAGVDSAHGSAPGAVNRSTDVKASGAGPGNSLSPEAVEPLTRSGGAT
jgi:Major Facilitator Superfamily